MRPSYKSDWQTFQRRNSNSREKAVQGFPDTNALSPNFPLFLAGEEAFHTAIQIAFGDGLTELIQRYVAQAYEWLDQLLAEHRFDEGNDRYLFPWNRGTKYAYRAVAKGMSQGTIPDLGDLRLAAQDLTDFFAKDTSRSDAGRNDYIMIAEWFIVCGEFDEASKMLKRARWKYYAERVEHVQAILAYARDARPLENQA